MQLSPSSARAKDLLIRLLESEETTLIEAVFSRERVEIEPAGETRQFRPGPGHTVVLHINGGAKAPQGA